MVLRINLLINGHVFSLSANNSGDVVVETHGEGEKCRIAGLGKSKFVQREK